MIRGRAVQTLKLRKEKGSESRLTVWVKKEKQYGRSLKQPFLSSRTERGEGT